MPRTALVALMQALQKAQELYYKYVSLKMH